VVFVSIHEDTYLATLVGARNCAAVEQLLKEELAETGEAVPTRQAIATWARGERWAEQTDDLWCNTSEHPGGCPACK
jgi:hypothetical protein